MRILADCDTGIDDALALAYLASRARAELVGVGSVHGNVAAEQAAANTLDVLERCGLGQVPVAVGARRPLVGSARFAGEWHGRDGLGDVARPGPRGRPTDEPAAVQLVRRAREAACEGEPLTLLATGPCTNLALALLLEPELASWVDRVVVMGGALRVPGNVGLLSEANIAADPEAAAIVVSAPWRVVLVSLDVTMQAILEDEAVERLARAGGLPGWCAAVTQLYLDRYQAVLGRRACPLHDPLAAAVACAPEIVRLETLPVAVELRGDWTRGATVADRRRGADRAGGGQVPARSSDAAELAGFGSELSPAGVVEVAVEVDGPAFADHFVSLLLEPEAGSPRLPGAVGGALREPSG